jgi:hypothetical protein
MPISPTTEGFRAAFRRPSLTLAEIMWRWTVGATAASVLTFGLFEYLRTLPVTNGELLFLRTRHPYLVEEAIAHILRGSGSRAVIAGLLAALLLTMLWMVAASVGRIATVRGLLEYFRRDSVCSVSVVGAPDGGISDSSISNGGERDAASNVPPNNVWMPLTALLRLNFLRVIVTVAALVGFVGAGILAGFASPASNPRPGIAFLLFLPLVALVCFLWGVLNWILSLAGMFAVRDGEDAMGAITSAVTFCRERTGAVFAVSTWSGMARLVSFVAAGTVASMPVGFAGIVAWRLVVAVMIVVTVAYFAVTDWLYMARLAGYVCIAETPEALLAPLPPVPLRVPPQRPGPPLQTTIDRDEPILSDLPNLAVET